MRSLVLALLLVAATSAADTYKWVDKDGVTHYSDRPVPGAEVIKLNEAQTYSPPAAASSSVARPTSETEPFTYGQLEIWSPENNETVSNTGNTVNVRVRLEPELRSGHSMWLFVDGRRQDNLPKNGNSFDLDEIWRGTHTLRAVVADNAGRTVAESPVVTFHMRQTNMLSPRSRVGGGN